MAVKLVTPGCLEKFPGFSTGTLSNILIPSLKPAKMAATIFRSQEYGVAKDYDAYIREIIEPNEGGHYYLFSDLFTNISKASFTVNLNEVTVEPKGKRTAYISISMASDGTRASQCDFGLACKEKGKWYAASWCMDHDLSTENNPVALEPDAAINVVYKEGIAPKQYLTGTETVKIEMVVEKSKVGGTVKDIIYQSMTIVGETYPFADIKYVNDEGELFKKEVPTPALRFTRFMSLVPNDGATADNPDQSRLNATLRNCKLNDQPWHSSSDYRIAFCWTCQNENILEIRPDTLASGGTANVDTIKIYENVKTH